MKLFLANISANLVASACVVFAGILAFHGKDGWGWFLFAALVATAYYKTSKDVKS